jgi:hypothetical protein
MQLGEPELEAELRRQYDEGIRLGYRAARSYQLFTPACKRYIGGVRAVQHLLRRGNTAGFSFAMKNDRPDLTIESLVLDSKFAHLFSDEDREMARQKLRDGGDPRI